MDFSALIAGGPIPAVNPEDLREVWELMQEARAQVLGSGEPEGATQQSAIGIDVAVLAEACSPGANVLAVWARSALLDMLERQGLLTPWQRGTQMDDAVFGVAASFPIPGIDRFDPEALLRQLSTAP